MEDVYLREIFPRFLFHFHFPNDIEWLLLPRGQFGASVLVVIDLILSIHDIWFGRKHP